MVLGTYVTPAWVHQSFGRKIEKAMECRDQKGTGVRIVHEEDWADALERQVQSRESNSVSTGNATRRNPNSLALYVDPAGGP